MVSEKLMEFALVIGYSNFSRFSDIHNTVLYLPESLYSIYFTKLNGTFIIPNVLCDLVQFSIILFFVND